MIVDEQQPTKVEASAIIKTEEETKKTTPPKATAIANAVATKTEEEKGETDQAVSASKPGSKPVSKPGSADLKANPVGVIATKEDDVAADSEMAVQEEPEGRDASADLDNEEACAVVKEDAADKED